MSPYAAIAASVTAPLLVAMYRRCGHADTAARDRAVVGVAGVADAVGDDLDAVAVAPDVIGDLGVAQSSGLVTTKRISPCDSTYDIRSRDPGFRPGVRLDAEAEAGGEELRGVAGVADPPLHVIEPEKVRGGAVRVTDLVFTDQRHAGIVLNPAQEYVDTADDETFWRILTTQDDEGPAGSAHPR